MQKDAKTLTLETGSQFAKALVAKDYAAAHTYLSQAAQATYSPSDLASQYEKMVAYGEEPIEVDGHVEFMADWPARQNTDLGWVYVSICGTGFAEAVTVIVSEEQGSPKIREIEWGRP